MFAMSSKYKCSYHWHHLYLLHTALSQFTEGFSFPLDLVVTDILNVKVHVLLCGVKIRSWFSERQSRWNTHTHTHTNTHICSHAYSTQEFTFGIFPRYKLGSICKYIRKKNLYYIIFCSSKNLRTYNKSIVRTVKKLWYIHTVICSHREELCWFDMRLKIYW